MSHTHFIFCVVEKEVRFFVSDLDFDSAAVRERFQHVVLADDAHRDAHLSDRPAYPAQAAGRGFSHYGARIAAALEAVHAQGSARISRRKQTAHAGIRECDHFCAQDERNAAPLGAQQLGGADEHTS